LATNRVIICEMWWPVLGFQFPYQKKSFRVSASLLFHKYSEVNVCSVRLDLRQDQAEQSTEASMNNVEPVAPLFSSSAAAVRYWRRRHGSGSESTRTIASAASGTHHTRETRSPTQTNKNTARHWLELTRPTRFSQRVIRVGCSTQLLFFF
jgi:hypothetical protein